MNQVKNLPWIAIRDIGFIARKAVASKKPPEELMLEVEAPAEYVKDCLMGEHFREGWFLSYHYHGEDYNLCRAEGEDADGDNKQLHIRIFDKGGDKCVIAAHKELCPINHPRRHLNGDKYSVEDGIKHTEELLAHFSVSHGKVERIEEGAT